MPREKLPPPADFDKESKALWRRTRDALQEQGTFVDSDGPALERYCRAVARARVARESLLADKDGAPILSTHGSQGQLVQHPNVKTAREAERDAHEYAKELLLTPATRKRFEIEGKKPPDGKFGSRLG